MERWEPIVDEATPVDVTEVSDAAVVEPIVAETSEPDAVVETPAPVEAILDVVAEPSEAVVEAVVEPVEAVVEPRKSNAAFCELVELKRSSRTKVMNKKRTPSTPVLPTRVDQRHVGPPHHPISHLASMRVSFSLVVAATAVLALNQEQVNEPIAIEVSRALSVAFGVSVAAMKLALSKPMN
ncbi:hypothetical protein AeRB84_015115 [Aphanomyces euteiches]|nr:hypothetical protein AeRB84_015115 [Aphanomyces euteiches]